MKKHLAILVLAISAFVALIAGGLSMTGPGNAAQAPAVPLEPASFEIWQDLGGVIISFTAVLCLAVLFCVVFCQTFFPSVFPTGKPMLCLRCGSEFKKSQARRRGSVWIEILLWFWVIPGLVYSLWRRTGAGKLRCPVCSAPEIIPASAPAAARRVEPPRSWSA